ncbi:MAG: hypothetical protein V1736_09860 [Pseudomonadota bacterium]
MEEILLVVHDKDKVKYATSLARELTEKLTKDDIKVTIFAEGSPAARMLIQEEGKLSTIKEHGGEIISCVHDIQDRERLERISRVVSECATELKKKETEGASVITV